MRTIAWGKLRDYGSSQPEALEPLKVWFRTVEKADWASFSDLRRDFAGADMVGNRVIFNIKGNRYRLIAAVSFPYRRVLVRWVGTHAEYDRLSEKEILAI